MEAALAVRALVQATSTMTGADDVVGSLASLLDSCRVGLAVDAAGVMVDAGGHLELLVASSHVAAELELHQLHVDEGPCVDAFRTGVPLQVSSVEALRSRWPAFGETMVGAGFASVHAAPLGRTGEVFGAMGLFRRSDDAFTADEDAVATAFADIATMLILHLGTVDGARLGRRLQATLDDRIVIEQAKGVLADSHDLDMAEAYQLLVQSAADRNQPLVTWARQVVSEAQSRQRT